MKTIARIAAFSGAGAGLSLVGLLVNDGSSPAVAYGDALLLCAATMLLAAWVWSLRLDGVALLYAKKRREGGETAPDKERQRRLLRSLAAAALALFALSLAFQYLIPRVLRP